MKVVLDPESIQMGVGYYTLPMGNIYFEAGDDVFPNREYTDFVSVLLLWWTEELINFVWGARTVKLKFIDEHYYIHLAHEEEDGVEFCKVYFGETRLNGNIVIRESEFDVIEFTKSMARAVNTLLRNEEFTKDMPEEAAELQLAYGRLQQLVKKKKSGG